MNKTLKWLGAGIALSLAAGCTTAPAPSIALAPPVVATSELPYHWSQGDAPRAHQDAVALFGPMHLKPGQYLWTATIPNSKDTRVVVDLMSQLFYVYRGDKLAGVSTISSGKKGKETPVGLWSVKIKKRLGYSRKYDNAPMPYMQMYDTAGIAFHGGANPGYPASHGCIRLPLKFAARLYDLTTVGTKVVIEG